MSNILVRIHWPTYLNTGVLENLNKNTIFFRPLWHFLCIVKKVGHWKTNFRSAICSQIFVFYISYANLFFDPLFHHSLLHSFISQHYKIRAMDNGGFFITARRTFRTLDELVHHYTGTADGLCSKLVKACPREAPAMTSLGKVRNRESTTSCLCVGGCSRVTK